MRQNRVAAEHTILRVSTVISVFLELVLAVRGCLSPLRCPPAGTVLAAGAENSIIVVFALRIRFLVADLFLGLQRAGKYT